MSLTVSRKIGLIGLALIPWLFAYPAYPLDIKKFPALQELALGLAESHGFSVQELQQLFRCATRRPEIIEAIERPRELLPWHEYRKIFVTEDNAARGLRFWKENAADLARAKERFAVAPEIIVAIIGIESRYGRSMGNFPVLDALATLTLDYPRRAEFFRKELGEFLLLMRETGIDACAVKGSYAGAIGLPQFIPSSYRRLAIDFDGDGRRDLLSSSADAIGSVANFLRQHGWEGGAPIVEETRLEGTLYFWVEKLGLKPSLSIRQLAEYGVHPKGDVDPTRLAALISLEGENGPMFRLGYANFHVINRYNHSKRYAMAVVELAELIRQRLESHSPS